MPKRKKSTVTLKNIAERVGILVRAASSALRENPDSEVRELQKLINSRTVDGIALVEPEVNDSRIEYLIKTGIPLVLFRPEGEGGRYTSP